MENNLPESWELVKLVEQINFLPTGVKEYSGTRKYYSTGSIQDNINTPEGEFTYKNRPSRANRLSVKGDVFQARMKATDKGILVDDKLHDQLFSTGFIQLRPYGNTYDNKLLYYLIKSEQFLTQKNECATGSTQEALTDTGASEIEIPLPPLAEQQRIVAKLDAVFEKIESNKKRLEKIPVILKRFRQSVLSAAVSGRLTEDWREKNRQTKLTLDELITIREENHNAIGERQKRLNKTTPKLPKFEVLENENLPDEWLAISVESATTFIIDCLHSTPKFTEDGDLCIDTTCIEPFKILYKSARKITKESFVERTSRMSPEKGDILFSREGTIGTAVLYNGEFPICLGQRMMMFRFANYVSPKYAVLYMASFYFKQLYTPFISGTSAQHLNIGDLRRLEFVLPPTKEQKEIVDRVEKLFALADILESRYNKAKVMLDKVPQSILAKAFRGELVSQNPDDEPASVLLERIKTEKEKLKAVKNTRKKK